MEWTKWRSDVMDSLLKTHLRLPKRARSKAEVRNAYLLLDRW